MTGTKVEAIHHHGVRAPERFVVGRVLSCERHPDADRLQRVRGRSRRGASRRARRRSCAARPTSPPGRPSRSRAPGAVMPDGMEIKRAKLRGVASEGMICAERELAHRPERGEGILVLDGVERGHARPGHAARAGAADRHGGARAGGHPQPPGLPRGVRGGARAARRHRRTAGVGAVERGPRQRGAAARRDGTLARGARGGRGAVPRPLPPLHRAGLRERDGRALAAVAEGAPQRRRAAADQQRGRHNQLRDAAHRPAAARLRPRPRRRRAAGGAPRRRGRAGADARRSDPHPRRGDGGDRGRRGPHLDRRSDGRRALGGAGRARRGC